MIKHLTPNEEENTIYDINLNSLYESGFKNIIVDVDNTITPWNTDYISDELVKWIREAKEKGFAICLLSNNKKQRVKSLASKLNVLAAPGGGKPFPRAFKGAIYIMEARKENTAVIGDQIFTDILGGNMMGLYTILVKPLSKKEFPGTKITRYLEKIIAKRK